jgi:hypothetical protein
MELEEGTDYTREGWRDGDEARLDNRPTLRYPLGRWNAAPDKRAFNDAWVKLNDAALNAYEAALSPELKAERSRLAEERMMAEAQAFYASRAPGDNRSFWD